MLESPKTLENKGDSDHFREEFRDFGESRDSSSEKTSFVMTPFSSRDRVLVLNCPPSPTVVTKIHLSFVAQKATKCTIADDCAQAAESGLKPPFGLSSLRPRILKNKQSRLEFSISLEIFSLA